MLIVSMAFGGHGTMSAASTQRNDKLQKVEQKENSHDAVLTDASNVYRVCNCRPQRIVPTWLTSSYGQGNKLPYYHKFFSPSLVEGHARRRHLSTLMSQASIMSFA